MPTEVKPSRRPNSGLDGLVGDALGQPAAAAMHRAAPPTQSHRSDHEEMGDGTEEGRAEKGPNRSPMMKALTLVIVSRPGLRTIVACVVR